MYQEEMRKCSCCLSEKEDQEFYKDGKSKDGLSYHCKPCVKERSQKYHALNREKTIQKSKERYWKNPELNRLKCLEYRIKNKEKIAAYKKAWREENPDCDKRKYAKHREKILEQQKKYYESNREKITVRAKVYREKNKEAVAKTKLRCYNNLRNRSMEFRILCALRSRLGAAIRGKNRSASTIGLLGCNVDDLMSHVELQFRDGMTWENYGKWELDHIKPCALFDLSSEQQQRECFHWTNIQPLWKPDNARKSDSFTPKTEDGTDSVHSCA